MVYLIGSRIASNATPPPKDYGFKMCCAMTKALKIIMGVWIEHYVCLSNLFLTNGALYSKMGSHSP